MDDQLLSDDDVNSCMQRFNQFQFTNFWVASESIRYDEEYQSLLKAICGDINVLHRHPLRGVNTAEHFFDDF